MSSEPSKAVEEPTVRKSLEELSLTIDKVYVETDELLNTLNPILAPYESKKDTPETKPPEQVELIGEIVVMHNSLRQSLGIIRLIRDHLSL